MFYLKNSCIFVLSLKLKNMKNTNKQLPAQGEWSKTKNSEKTNMIEGFGSSLFIWDGQKCIAEISSHLDGKNNLQRVKEQEETGDKICTAINNTYGKGINPEAVPELLRAFKRLLHDGRTDENKKDARVAIKKAEL